MDKKSDASDWYFTGKIILMKDNFQEIKRSRVGRGGTDLLKKINEYEGENCYIPTDGHCFIVNRVLNEDYTREFQEYINGFSKANRKGVMTCARMKEFNKKFNTSFQIYNPKNRHFHPRDVHDELDWVFYLHNSHFCLIRRSQKSLGIQEIEGNYEQVWKTCRDDNAVTQVSPLKLNVLSKIEEKEITTEDSKSTRLTPSYLGSFVLSHSKKIMNNFIHVINGFYKPEIYYTDTDSLYISSKNWKKLNRAGLVSEKDYCKGKNDYGDGGIIFGLYLAPKVKYNIVLTSDGVLKEKKTFKGYSNDKISVEDYVQLASGHDVSNQFNKPWEKSFTNGVVIPNDKQTKVFRSYLNNVKRKPPNSEGIMYPYNDKDEYSFDENYEFDDFDYLSNQEENEDCFK
ncbi:hypothetical protein LOTGIDRAFT_157596 [Lottia gigantea]|uniref:DNA-directed DNA polymerase n=1 Tax=Lottia gigantea TaxID=225164 RepID=V4CH47_LOTGI|nr:hypothetical protein LOTGIDRAFT_157596 [Lottia gigantea]ESP01415.1 hypothetical protein LOTGIDRAFT_157596 [Lottia gigantea]